jgi:hypothetical protein
MQDRMAYLPGVRGRSDDGNGLGIEECFEHDGL